MTSTELPLSDGSGTIQRHSNFPSRYIDSRPVDVWLPPGYHANSQARFPVLYMHDGQFLFDPSPAYGRVDWGIDEAITKLSTQGVIPETIVVGIWNSPQRWREYMPQKAFAKAGRAMRAKFLQKAGGQSYSDDYLRFLVNELKPFIDLTYHSRPEQEYTLVMGSSLGGLISLYAISEYPQVFTGAGCLSTHWPAGENFLVDFMGKNLPDPAGHRLYFDYGTLGLDVDYEPFQQRMDKHLRAAGYTPGKSCLTRKFTGADHNEASWRERVDIPLAFLMGKGES